MTVSDNPAQAQETPDVIAAMDQARAGLAQWYATLGPQHHQVLREIREYLYDALQPDPTGVWHAQEDHDRLAAHTYKQRGMLIALAYTVTRVCMGSTRQLLAEVSDGFSVGCLTAMVFAAAMYRENQYADLCAAWVARMLPGEDLCSLYHLAATGLATMGHTRQSLSELLG